jgi:hypothetical protein
MPSRKVTMSDLSSRLETYVNQPVTANLIISSYKDICTVDLVEILKSFNTRRTSVGMAILLDGLEKIFNGGDGSILKTFILTTDKNDILAPGDVMKTRSLSLSSNIGVVTSLFDSLGIATTYRVLSIIVA